MTRSLPEDPFIRDLVNQARRAHVSRRTMLQGAGIGAAALTLAACAPEGGNGAVGPADNSANDPHVTWATWPLYIDDLGAGSRPTLEAFQRTSGVTVEYSEEIDDNNSYFAKVKDQLANGQHIGADVVTLTDWMVNRWIRLDYAQELNLDNIPNHKNLDPALADVSFDPGRKLSLPYQRGFAGICWDKEKIPGGLQSVNDLWKAEYKGRIGVLSEMRDTIGLLMLQNGVDISGAFSTDDFSDAVEVLRKQVHVGHVRNVRGNSYINDLITGDTVAGIAWSGDVASLNAAHGDKWEFLIPEAGGTIWTDNFLVPLGSPRKSNAEKLINHYYDPEIAAEVAAWVNYVTPVVGAREAAERIDPALADNPLIFPDADTLSRAKQFRTLNPAEEQSFGTEFQSVLIGA
jgi:spermidine/putrescine transport system substrate-binding protein